MDIKRVSWHPEILAQQHFKNILKLTESLIFRVALLTGQPKERKVSYYQWPSLEGKIHILIGTHAVHRTGILFKQLGFSHHRRTTSIWCRTTKSRGWSKAIPLPPHVIVMTKTPIPRTLTNVRLWRLRCQYYRPIASSRKPIKTIHYHELKRTEMEYLMKTGAECRGDRFLLYSLSSKKWESRFGKFTDGLRSYFQSFSSTPLSNP